MKFHLFRGENYYPGGGIEDYSGSFETIEEAQESDRLSANAPYYSDGPRGFKNTWAQILEDKGDRLERVFERLGSYGWSEIRRDADSL